MVLKLQAKLIMNEEVLFYIFISTIYITVFDISFTSGIYLFHIFLNILIMSNSSKHQRGKKKNRKTEEKPKRRRSH